MEKDLQFESEKAAKYLETARIQLHWLSFQDSALDAKHVQVLKLSFEGDCMFLPLSISKALIPHCDFPIFHRLSYPKVRSSNLRS